MARILKCYTTNAKIQNHQDDAQKIVGAVLAVSDEMATWVQGFLPT
jgi:hypothetical protein